MKSNSRIRITNARGLSHLDVVILLVVVFVCLSLLLMMLPNWRESSRKTLCQYRMQRIVLALNQYLDSMQTYPSGCIDPAPSLDIVPLQNGMGWIPQVSEQFRSPMQASDGSNVGKSIELEIDFRFPAIGDENLKARSSVIPSFLCPSHPTIEGPRTNYVGNAQSFAGPIGQSSDGILFLNSAVRITDITDSLDNTVILGERTHSSNVTENDKPFAYRNSWAIGDTATIRTGGFTLSDFQQTEKEFAIDPHSSGFDSYHVEGCLFGYCSGRADWISRDISPDVMERLLRRNDFSEEMNGNPEPEKKN